MTYCLTNLANDYMNTIGPRLGMAMSLEIIFAFGKRNRFCILEIKILSEECSMSNIFLQ